MMQRMFFSTKKHWKRVDSSSLRQNRVLLQAMEILNREADLSSKNGDLLAKDYVEAFGTMDLNGEEAPVNLIQQRMQQNHFKNKMAPRILSTALSQSLLKDLFGVVTDEQVPPLQDRVLVDWPVEKGRWYGLGQSISPETSKTTPTIKVWSNSPYISIMLLDLDYPVVSLGLYKEFVHLLALNIKVDKFVEFKPSSNDSIPYMPLHPPKELPNHPHRIACLVYRHDNPISPPIVQPPAVEEKAPWISTPIPFPNRLFGPSRLPKEASLSGLWFARTEWTLETSQIFQELGINQPVLGPFPKDVVRFVSRLQSKKTLAEPSTGQVPRFQERRRVLQKLAREKYASPKTKAKQPKLGLRDVIRSLDTSGPISQASLRPKFVNH
jgi:hypothetical protein